MLKFINSAGDTGLPSLYYRTRVDSDGDLRFEISKDNKTWALLTYIDGPIDRMEFLLEGKAE